MQQLLLAAGWDRPYTAARVAAARPAAALTAAPAAASSGPAASVAAAATVAARAARAAADRRRRPHSRPRSCHRRLGRPPARRDCVRPSVLWAGLRTRAPG